ncbi:antitoxin [Mycobacterium sp. Y57]|uniref:antitoxin n=1 Tax=Mycolicibacterium xanthum TaxID=2796469 RepID=UPI001C847DD8|nr:antitoxin [Mycolicibacterium xanthum]MBX7433857.1 antitoxin [Mycolicibacterium xanthum]
MGFLDKAKDLLSKNADKVDTAIDKAADIVDQKTHGKYASTVDKVQDAAKKAVADNTTPDREPPASPPPPQG